MLFQEHNYRLYRNGEIEDDDRSHGLIENHNSTVSVGLSDPVSCAKISSPPSSFNNKLRRTTFDLSSVNSLATSSSESSCYYVSAPTRIPSALRYRGQSSPSSSYGNPSLPEGAATESFVQLAAHDETNSALREVPQEPREIMRSWNETQGAKKLGAASSVTSNDSQPDSLTSIVLHFLEVILLGYLVVPLLELTIRTERLLRSKFGDLQRSAGLLFQEEATHFESGKLYSSSNTPMLQQYQQQLLDVKEDYCDQTSEFACCHSSSSSIEGDSTDEHATHDGWGHFTDFQDELADEASFLPSCSVGPLRPRAAVALLPSCVNALETLAESREEDDCAGEDWTF